MATIEDVSVSSATGAGPGPARRRLLVIYNPAAGRRTRRRLDAALRQLAVFGAEIDLRETGARGDAEAIARTIDARDYDVVVAAGGDGTINEIVNGLAETDLPLAILPLGTGNVLAEELRLSRRPAALAALISFGAEQPVWIATVEDRRFVMMAGVGFDAAVVEGLDEALKRRVGKLAFAWEIIVQIWRYRPCRYRVSCDGAEFAPASAVIAKGRFYAGRFILAPAARLAEPDLHLILFMTPGRIAALRYLAAMALGRIHRLADIVILRTQSVTITGPEGAPVEGDGDILAHLPVRFGVAARPLRIIAPD